MDIRETMIQRLIEEEPSRDRDLYKDISDEDLLDMLIDSAYLAGIYRGGC